MSKSQLNYDGINASDYSEDVQKAYAFPEDKQYLYRIMRGERRWNRQELINAYDSAQNDAIYSVLAVCASATAFAFYLMPAGKVMRDRYVSNMSATRRLFRQFVPFAGLAFPIYILRSRLDEGNGYID